MQCYPNCVLVDAARRHALLESPTGTGKTLALLSTCLATQWARQQAIGGAYHQRLIYVSRTHAQVRCAVHHYNVSRESHAHLLAVSRCHVSECSVHATAGSGHEGAETDTVRALIRTHHFTCDAKPVMGACWCASAPSLKCTGACHQVPPNDEPLGLSRAVLPARRCATGG
jgi:hypothetical protein